MKMLADSTMSIALGHTISTTGHANAMNGQTNAKPRTISWQKKPKEDRQVLQVNIQTEDKFKEVEVKSKL